MPWMPHWWIAAGSIEPVRALPLRRGARRPDEHGTRYTCGNERCKRKRCTRKGSTRKGSTRKGSTRKPMVEDLARAIRNRQAILFAGAGVSMTVGLPSWRTLVEHIGQELCLDAEILAAPDMNYL